MCRKAATDLEVPTREVRLTKGKADTFTNIRLDLLNYIEHVNSTYDNNIIPPNNAVVIEPLPRIQVRELDDDAQIVATQANVSLNTATEALQRANGDIVNAIMALILT
jgi:hypothetical protein